MKYNSFQANGRVNLILPGSLMPLNKEITDIVRIEIARFIANQRFSKVFSNIDLKHMFANKANLKKLIVRTKVG